MRRDLQAMILLIAPAILAAPLYAQGAAELLTNRGFESARPGSSAPAGWGGNAFGTRTTVALDREQAHSGLFSARITGVPGNNRGGFGHCLFSC